MSQTKAQLIDPVDGTIVNADINASAAIAGTKVSPDFGSQAISTTGGLSINGATVFNESGADVDFRIEGDTLANLFYVDAGNDRIGIGTSSPAYNLDISNSSGEGQLRIDSSAGNHGMIRFSQGGTNKSYIQHVNGNDLAFGPGGSEKVRIDSSGKVGIGISSPATILHIQSNKSSGTVDGTRITNTEMVVFIIMDFLLVLTVLNHYN